MIFDRDENNYLFMLFLTEWNKILSLPINILEMSGRYREFDENEALENAAHVFWLKGFDAATTEDLLAAMKLNKGSMYNAFGNKRQLFLQAFHAFSQRFLHNTKQIFKNHDNPVEAIKEIFYSVARASDPIMHSKGCFYVNILGEMSGLDDELAELAQQKLKDVEAVFYKELKRGMENGYINCSLDPLTMSKYLVNLWNGMSISRRLYSKEDLEMLVETNLKILY